MDPAGYNSSIPTYNPIDLQLVFKQESFMMLGKGMFVFNNTLTAIAGMTKPNQLNDEFMRSVRDEAGGTWLSWYRSYNFDIMASVGKYPLMALGLGGWFSYYFDIIKWPGALLIAILGLAVGKTYFDAAKDLGYGIFNATKTATGWVINASWTLILTSAQLNGNDLTQTEMAVRFGARLVVTGGIVYLVESIGIGDSIRYLQYLSYVYNGVAMLSGVTSMLPSMLGMSNSKKLIGSTNLSGLKLLKGVSEYFSKFLTSNNVIDNFNSLSKARQLELMNKFMNGTEYNNLVTNLTDVPAQSIITEPFDNVELFVDQVDAGNFIVTINWLSQGGIVYTFVSLIDNILESRGTWRQISSYFATPESDQRPLIENEKDQRPTITDVEGFTDEQLIGQGTELPEPNQNEIEAEENRQEEAAAAEEERRTQGQGATSTTTTATATIPEQGATQAATAQNQKQIKYMSVSRNGVPNNNYEPVMNKLLGEEITGIRKTREDIINDLGKLENKFNTTIRNDGRSINDLVEDTKTYKIKNAMTDIQNLLKELRDNGNEEVKEATKMQGGGLLKKKGSKKNKVEKKKGRKTKRKMYTKKKKGNSKKHKKKSKVKRNTRRK